ncbi:MAG TPA: hypothetical protein VLI04_11205 [Nocardioidaceae bacterium]|nr:hypothetical protein [Nocardioidaceae bacterium]
MTRQPRLQAPWAAVLMGWLTIVLLLDSGGTLWQQRGLGALTWVVLAVAMLRVTPLVRAQTAVVVAFATVIEYLCSPTLEVYLYRFENVPMYVPPGHGLVYLSAYALGHALWVERHQRIAITAAVVGLGGWGLYALVQPRHDVLGAMWFVCLVVFLWKGPSREVYLGAAVVVTWLEIAGTALGTWEWQAHDPLIGIPIGNPPTGAAGGYGWFDLAGLLAAPFLVRYFTRRREQVVDESSDPALTRG